MRKYGLIGKSLSHSFSPAYFKNKFESLNILDAEYSSYELSSIDQVKSLINDGIDGFNVTIPYKQAVMAYLTEIEPSAKEIGAVNCVKKIGTAYKGFNTDWLGFRLSLIEFINGNETIKALVLGDGGASKAVCYALKDLDIEFEIVSRNETHLQYHQVDNDCIASHFLIINTTSLGMYPDIDSLPLIPYDNLSTHHFLYDIVYNPAKTRFLEEGEKRKAHIKNGYDMLINQADESWKIWSLDERK